MWGSRITNTRGRQLQRSLNEHNLECLSTCQPTYWPSDRQKIPDLLDFFITKGIPRNYMNVDSSLDLSSDHSHIIGCISTSMLMKPLPPSLSCNKTDWEHFRNIIEENLSVSVSLKTKEEVDEAVDYLNKIIQESAWKATACRQTKYVSQQIYPIEIKRNLAEKLRLRRVWQQSRSQIDKNNFNRAAQNLKRSLRNVKNQWFQEFTSQLSPTEASD